MASLGGLSAKDVLPRDADIGKSSADLFPAKDAIGVRAADGTSVALDGSVGASGTSTEGDTEENTISPDNFIGKYDFSDDD